MVTNEKYLKNVKESIPYFDGGYFVQVQSINFPEKVSVSKNIGLTTIENLKKAGYAVSYMPITQEME